MLMFKMHSSSFQSDRECSREGGDVLVAIATLVTEGRIPSKIDKSRSIFEGPHCPLNNHSLIEHNCNPSDNLCKKYEYVQSQILSLWRKNIPICIEVFLVPICSCENNELLLSGSEFTHGGILLEQWYLTVNNHKHTETTTPLNLNQLINAVRSQLYFSQITAWLSPQGESEVKLLPTNFRYRLVIPGETYKSSKFMATVSKHNFPATDLGNGLTINVTLLSLPRMTTVPNLKCQKCDFSDLEKQIKMEQPSHENIKFFDDRMYTVCTLKGKHRCEDLDDFDPGLKEDCAKLKRVCNNKGSGNVISEPSTSRQLPKLQVDIVKANLYRQKYLKNVEMNKMEKRNSSPNTEQSVKTPKLDLNEINDALKVLNGGGCSENHRQCKTDLNRQLHNEQGNDPVMLILRNCRLQNDENITQNDNKMSNLGSISGSSLCGNSSNRRSVGLTCVQKLESTAHTATTTTATGGSTRNNHTYNGCCWSHVPPSPSTPRGEMRECCASDSSKCDNLCETSDIFNSNKEKINIYVDNKCDSYLMKPRYKKMRDISNVAAIANNNNNNHLGKYVGKARQRITFENFPSNCNLKLNSNNINGVLDNCDNNVNIATDEKRKDDRERKKCYDRPVNILPSVDIPSPIEQAKFRKSLDSAASMVFHSRTGLPLTSSPAPVRRGKRFDFDSSINSVSAIKSALFSASFTTDDDSESDGSIVSPCSPDSYSLPKRESSLIKYYRKGHSANLLGSFEESVLNGRLEPVSTVHGFTAELGASGSFVPRHLVVPVTVFFYTLGDNDKVSSPYLGHINLGKKGYNVPKTGTVQVTLFNPLGTVVKMFVIMYDLKDMPPNSQTFIRQRTLYMPTNCKDENLEWGPKWLRYLIHLRFMSSKSGRIYLHSDIRMIIFRKSDLDTATAHGIDMSYELRSFTHTPTNPKYSPRK